MTTRPATGTWARKIVIGARQAVASALASRVGLSSDRPRRGNQNDQDEDKDFSWFAGPGADNWDEIVLTPGGQSVVPSDLADLLRDVPADAISGTRREAGHAAELFVDFLQRRGIKPRGGRPFQLHAALNVAAALRIKEWQEHQLMSTFPHGLPAADAALSDAVAALEGERKTCTAKDRSGSLSHLCFRTWFHHFSWSAREEIGVDVVLVHSGKLAEAGLAALAELLIRHGDVSAGE